MLRGEERFVILDLYRKGVSISEIARRTGHDRKTVRSLLHQPVVPAPKPVRPRPRKIDPYIPYLEQRIADGVLNGRKLCRELQAHGYPGREMQVRLFLKPYRQARKAAATVRFETAPGEQAQVDWGHFGFIAHHGRRRPLYAFVMTLGWSRTMSLEFTVSADTAWFLRCHRHAFHYFGGIPRQVLHDNLKTAVVARDADGTIHWHPPYLDFAHHYGFTPRACQPYRAQTKGKVESGIKYVRGNFWLGLTFTDLADLNVQARVWLDTVANVRVHGTTGIPPFTRLADEELTALSGMPDYDTSVVGYRYSSADCFVSYDGNYYSVPACAARHHLLVRETEQAELIISDADGTELARHHLVHGVNQRVVNPAHDAALSPRPTRTLRAGAIQHLAPPRVLPLLPDAPAVEVRALREYDRLIGVRR